MADKGADAKATCAPYYKHDVYISFRGKDTRQGIVGHLFDALRREKLIVYTVKELHHGENILPDLCKAIEESKILLVIFSKNYAYSRWCLDELEKISECKKMNNQLVYPIFYNVDPSHVTHQTGCYGDAMAKHEYRFGSDSEKVHKWRSALTEVAKLRRLDLSTRYQNEYEVIQKIVKWITKSLARLSLGFDDTNFGFSSLSLPNLPHHDIYLSFTGLDTTLTFEDSLYDALHSNGFRAFINDGSLKSGDQIEFSIIKAIENSRIAIIVFSENFAFSELCLNELEKILECKKIKNQLVYPIFYNVDPSHVRHQACSYGDAMAKHEYNFGDDSEKVHNWRSALTEVVELIGLDLATRYQTEYEVIQDILKWITKSLPSSSLPSSSLSGSNFPNLPRHDVYLNFTVQDTPLRLHGSSPPSSSMPCSSLLSSSLLSSNFPILPRHDVYLSFTGQDTPLNFGDSLNDALLSNGFRGFINDGSLKSSNQIEFSFIKAIENSSIAIIVFSKNFASSTFCLHQLVKIHECKKMKNLLVYPIFYDMDPSHVWHQNDSYSEAMARHEWRFGGDSEEVQKWRSALTEIGTLDGLYFKSWYQQQNELIESIVKWVTKSLPSLPRNDVFLSFSGVDAHFLFIDHLSNALSQAGFETFKNDEALEDEDQISPSLINAMEQSRLSIIVFSENYGYSSYCLDQLVKILECMEMKNQQVWPIFYKVDSSDLRHQRNTFGKAMTAHENRFGKDSEKVRKWRSALTKVSYLRGWHFKTGSEYEFIQRIVKNANNI